MIARATADYLIVGSGIAGLRAAVELASHGRVLVLTKSDPGAGSTGYAQGGIAAAVGAGDTPTLHAKDTLAAGDGLCDPRAVNTLVEEGPRYVEQLLQWGASFDRNANGDLDLAREGAHSVRRVLHAHDATGREIARVLATRLTGLANVSVIDHALVVQIIVDRGRALGVRYLDERGQLREAVAGATLLATGGAGQAYRETTNPTVATGDGVALAYLAGAAVVDLEFVQFHPTVLAVPGAPRYLLSEALRGEGAVLVNEQGERFMSRYDPSGDLAARDRVARAMVRESARTSAPVYLTLSHLPADAIRARFPVIADLCRRVGLDLATDRLPVGPAAHYLMGGVTTDTAGRTSVRGLFAAGEAAATGVHGANRLASNSLLEGLVFGGRAAMAMVDREPGPWPAGASLRDPDPPPTGAPYVSPLTEMQLRELMWTNAGIFRDRDGLESAAAVFDDAWTGLTGAMAGGAALDPAAWRTASLLIVSRLIVRAALRREESRGAHSRTDFPQSDDLHWKRRVTEVRNSDAPTSHDA